MQRGATCFRDSQSKDEPGRPLQCEEGRKEGLKGWSGFPWSFISTLVLESSEQPDTDAEPRRAHAPSLQSQP